MKIEIEFEGINAEVYAIDVNGEKVHVLSIDKEGVYDLTDEEVDAFVAVDIDEICETLDIKTTDINDLNLRKIKTQLKLFYSDSNI